MDATTYDGQAIAREAPFGATVVVWRRGGGGAEVLLLHRAHHGPEHEGDWAWTPPAGARWPGEAPLACARRELLEETGLDLPIAPVAFGEGDWLVFAAEAPAEAVVILDPEHDRFEWLAPEAACARCAPPAVAAQVRAAMVAAEASALVFRKASADDVVEIPRLAGGPAWNGGAAKWERYWREHQAGARTCLVAHDGRRVVAYASVVWTSQHAPFAETGVPEIQDVVVAEDWRRRGVGERLMSACEALVRAAGHAEVGLGVGLYADYGAAQRLYVRRGYLPDGAGLTWNNKPAEPGAMVRVDDDLVLWLRRPL